MTLKDAYNDSITTLPELKHDYLMFRKEDPENYAYYESFTDYLHEVLMATINGRNECQIIGMTPAEISRYILRLRKALKR